MPIKPEWTQIRAFVAQPIEGHAADPADGVFVLPPEPINEDLHISFSGVSITDALGNPGSGVFWIWAHHNDGVTNVKEKLAELSVAAADSGHIMPLILRPGPSKIYVTIDSTVAGGFTVSGTVRMRRVGR